MPSLNNSCTLIGNSKISLTNSEGGRLDNERKSTIETTRKIYFCIKMNINLVKAVDENLGPA